MKILSKFKGMLMTIMALGIFFTIGSKSTYAVESNITSGIYEVQNDVYHESETGMAMSRSYLLPTMSVEVTKDHIIYTVGFSGSEYMENYRMTLNGQEVPVEVVEEGNEEGTVKLKVEVDKVDADMDALIYVGPMERDVQFKVIPKMETLTLVEAIEEEVVAEVNDSTTEEITTEDVTSEDVIEDNNTAVEEVETNNSVEEVESNNSNNKNIVVIAVSVAIIAIVIGIFATIKFKKKSA